MKTYDQMCLESLQLQLVTIQSFMLEIELHKMGLTSDEKYKDILTDMHGQLAEFTKKLDRNARNELR